MREELHRFFRAARGAGVRVSPAESIDAMKAVAQAAREAQIKLEARVVALEARLAAEDAIAAADVAPPQESESGQP